MTCLFLPLAKHARQTLKLEALETSDPLQPGGAQAATCVEQRSEAELLVHKTAGEAVYSTPASMNLAVQ